MYEREKINILHIILKVLWFIVYDGPIRYLRTHIFLVFNILHIQDTRYKMYI